jgi:hypothetical protein
MSDEQFLNKAAGFHKANGINLRATQKHPFKVPDEPDGEEPFADEFGKFIRGISRLGELSGSRSLSGGR